MLRRLVIALLAFSVFAAAQGKRPFTFEDMMALKRVGDPAISPDGKWVLVSAQDVNLDENTRKPHLWIVPLAGGQARQLTNGNAGEDRGRFSPDGKRIAYLTARDGGTQIWVQDFDGGNGALSGEPVRLTNLSTEASGHQWSPDGTFLLFVSDVFPDCPPNDDACNKQRDEAAAKSKVKAKIFNRLMFRHWNRYEDGKRSHLFIVPVDGSAAPRDLTPGDHDVPPFNLGGQDYYAISPDSKEVAYTVNLTADTATSTNNDIYVVPITGGEPRKISRSPGSDSHPIYSPDGKYIAYRMQEQNGFESDRFQLLLFDRALSAYRNLTPTFPNWVGTITWAPDSRSIYFSSEDKGEAPIYRVGLDGKAPPVEVIRGHNDDPMLSPDGKTLLFTRNSVRFPNEIFTIGITGGKATGKEIEISKINEGVLSQVHMSPVEQFWYTGAANDKVHGFIVKPPNFDPAKKYPVKMLVHGGPQGNFGDSWTYRWNANLFAANGYVVAMVNFHGSTGYGQRFIDSIRGDWGGKPYVDVMRGMDYVETLPYVAKGTSCVLGASYGGYLVNWIIGNTQRFNCAVSHDGTFNSISQYGTTEELYFKEWEYLGTPWSKGAVYQKWSPHQLAPNMKTPTLVIHGQLDYRLDVSEGFQLFTALQRHGTPSRFLYFPDEGHWVLKPQNSRLWYQTVNAWVDEWVKKPRAPVPPPPSARQ
jgi:dipeptidyl aminopeptidase/acylaminoacyl peptidase